MNGAENRLFLRDIPIFMYLFGLIFAGVGVLILTGGGVPLMGLVFILVGLAALLLMSVLTITADRTTRSLKLEYRSVMRYKAKEFFFDDIAGISVERRTSHSKGGVQYTYTVVMKLKDGSLVPFRKSSSSGAAKKERIAARLREFMGVQSFDTSPAGSFYSSLGLNPGEIYESHGVHWQVEPVVHGDSAGTRWRSPDFKTQGYLLVLAQKAEGQSSQGFMASLGSMIFKQTLPLLGIGADDTPGLDQATALSPLEPGLEAHFMAYTNAPDLAPRLLNPEFVKRLGEWAARYPLKHGQKASNLNQLVVLFGPNGVCLATMVMLQRERLDELSALAVELVRSQLRTQSAY